MLHTQNSPPSLVFTTNSEQSAFHCHCLECMQLIACSFHTANMFLVVSDISVIHHMPCILVRCQYHTFHGFHQCFAKCYFVLHFMNTVQGVAGRQSSFSAALDHRVVYIRLLGQDTGVLNKYQLTHFVILNTV